MPSRTPLLLAALLGAAGLPMCEARLGTRASVQDNDASDAALARLAAQDTNVEDKPDLPMSAAPSADLTPHTAKEQVVMQQLQGTMLLAQLMPHEFTGTKPSAEVQDDMDRAGTLGYDAYALLQSTEQEIGAAREHIGTGVRINDGLKQLPSTEAMVGIAAKKLQQAKDLDKQARAKFFANASPLGDPPVAPKSWVQVSSILERADETLKACREKVNDIKTIAKGKGVSLMSVNDETAVVLEDSYGKSQDSAIEDFVNNFRD